MYKIFLTILFCLSCDHVFGAIIEKYTDSTVCDLNDSDKVNDCLKQAVQNFLSKMDKGIKEINLIPFNPLYVPMAQLSENSKGATTLSLVLIETKHSHITEGTVLDVKFTEKEKFMMRFSIPKLTIVGNYKVKGKILALPIFGEGKTLIEAVDNKVVVEMILKQRPGKDGKTYIYPEKVSIKVSPGKTHFDFENLLNNKELSDNMNKFLNENYEEVLNEILPSLNDMYTQILQSVLNNVFASKPAEEFITNPM